MSSEMNNNNTVGERKHPIKVIFSVAWWIMLLLIGALMVNIIGAKLSGKVPHVFGYSVMNIITGSMGDDMPVGSYILVKKVDAETVEIGDIICFYSSEPDIYGMPNTHRVVEPPIVKEDGKIEFVTRGDAANGNDAVNAKGEDLIGVYVKRIFWLERFASALNGSSMLVLIFVLQGGIVAMITYTVIAAKRRDDGDDGDSVTKENSN